MKIQISEDVLRWNAQIELADFALGLSAVDVHDPRKLLSLLSISGQHELRATLTEAGARLGYWAPDGGPAPGERPEPRHKTPEDRTRSACRHEHLVYDRHLHTAECEDCLLVLLDLDKPFSQQPVVLK